LNNKFKYLPIVVILYCIIGINSGVVAQNCTETLQQANNMFANGETTSIPELLDECISSGFTEEEKKQAYKLLVQVYMIENNIENAEKAINHLKDLNRKTNNRNSELERISQKDIDYIYGLNPVLYNGKIYTYFVPSKVEGHQFIYEKEYLKGSVTIKDIKYDDLQMNYDLLNQEILLNYTTTNGANQLIVLSKAWLNKFTLNGSTFQLIEASGLPNRIYQVIGNGDILLLYSWSKDMVHDNLSGIPVYKFTVPKKELFIYRKNQIRKFRSNRTFLKLFNGTKQQEIKKYLRQQKVNVKKANNMQMNTLIDYCNKL